MSPIESGDRAREVLERISIRGADGRVESVCDRTRSVTLAFASVDASSRAMGRLEALDCGLRCSWTERAVAAGERDVAERTMARRRAEDLAIPGLTLIENFVSVDEERALVTLARESGEETRLARRRVKHFGYAFDYGTRDANERCEAIPSLALEILKRLRSDMIGYQSAIRCDQVTVNEYPRGTGLAPHVDTHSAFGETILSLTLEGCAVMEFRTSAEENRALFLPRRSMLVLSADARYRWQHYIPHRKFDNVEGETIARDDVRLSYTFRERRSGPCMCAFPMQCDSRDGAESKCSKRRAGKTQEFPELVGE